MGVISVIGVIDRLRSTRRRGGSPGSLGGWRLSMAVVAAGAKITSGVAGARVAAGAVGEKVTAGTRSARVPACRAGARVTPGVAGAGGLAGAVGASTSARQPRSHAHHQQQASARQCPQQFCRHPRPICAAAQA